MGPESANNTGALVPVGDGSYGKNNGYGGGGGLAAGVPLGGELVSYGGAGGGVGGGGGLLEVHGGGLMGGGGGGGRDYHGGGAGGAKSGRGKLLWRCKYAQTRGGRIESLSDLARGHATASAQRLTERKPNPVPRNGVVALVLVSNTSIHACLFRNAVSGHQPAHRNMPAPASRASGRCNNSSMSRQRRK